MLEIKRKNEIKKLPLLYVLFCLLLKIDPLPAKMDFGKARVKITKEISNSFNSVERIELVTLFRIDKN